MRSTGFRSSSRHSQIYSWLSFATDICISAVFIYSLSKVRKEVKDDALPAYGWVPVNTRLPRENCAKYTFFFSTESSGSYSLCRLKVRRPSAGREDLRADSRPALLPSRSHGGYDLVRAAFARSPPRLITSSKVGPS